MIVLYIPLNVSLKEIVFCRNILLFTSRFHYSEYFNFWLLLLAHKETVKKVLFLVYYVVKFLTFCDIYFTQSPQNVLYQGVEGDYIAVQL